MKVVNEKADDWDDHLEPVLFGYRVNVQSSTKTTPFELLYGVKARLPIDVDHNEDVDATDEVEETLAERVKQLAESLQQTRTVTSALLLLLDYHC